MFLFGEAQVVEAGDGMDEVLGPHVSFRAEAQGGGIEQCWVGRLLYLLRCHRPVTGSQPTLPACPVPDNIPSFTDCLSGSKEAAPCHPPRRLLRYSFPPHHAPKALCVLRTS